MSSLWRVTFGRRYAHEPHPSFPGAHPDGWLTVEAADGLSYEAIRAGVIQILGTNWCALYDAARQDPEDEDELYYPMGELARIHLTEDPNLRTWPAMAVD